MKLRLKLFTLFSASYLLIFVIMQLASNSLLLTGMEELEDREMTTETLRGLTSFENMISEIEGATNRFSSYNNIFRYTMNPELISEEYVWSVLSEASLSEAEVDYVLLFDQAGEELLSRGYHQGKIMNVPEEVITFFEMNSILVVHQSVESKLSGLLKTPVGLCIISSQPVSSGADTIVGSIVMCRLVDLSIVEQLSESIFLDLNLLPLLDQELIAMHETVIGEITPKNPVLIEKLDSETVKGYSVLNDLYGNPALLLSVESSRLIYGIGLQMVNYFAIAFILIGISIGMLAMVALNRLVIMPLSKLSNEVSDINPQTLNDNRVEISGNDEISSLSQDIDKMLDALREYQNRIKETERMVSIGATATMVGHDLRNPLQVVVMLTDLIQKKINKLSNGEPDEQHKEIQRLTNRVKEQATYMNKIVSDLQGLTKGLSLEIEDVDIKLLVEEVLETVMIPHNIQPKTLFYEDFPEIFADRAKLQRVFTNLINNAIQAMLDGGELVVKGHVDKEKVYISVIDTGCGISEENQKKIFDPLFTTKAKGTGLGLTVCKRIIEAHSGEIATKSHPEIGTRFTVTLPIKYTPETIPRAEEIGLDYSSAMGPILPTNL